MIGGINLEGSDNIELYLEMLFWFRLLKIFRWDFERITVQDVLSELVMHFPLL